MLPALALAVALARDALGANPVEELTHETGEWGLRFLLASLAITPLRRLLGWRAAGPRARLARSLAPARRTLGLLTFSYAAGHLSVYLLLDQGLAWGAIWEDVAERRYITAGFAAFCCLTPLAVTSTRGWMRRLGRRWSQLHRLAYLAGGLALVHLFWLTKADYREPAIYAGLLALLLLARLWRPRPASA